MFRNEDRAFFAGAFAGFLIGSVISLIFLLSCVNVFHYTSRSKGIIEINGTPFKIKRLMPVLQEAEED
jgi:hypothetical protein